MVQSSRASRVGLGLFEYDFSVLTGAQGAYIVGANRLPAGAIILDGIIHIVAACTSTGSATVAVSVVGANDLLTATAVASLTLNALFDVVPVCSAATAIRLTAAAGVTFTIATEDLTAGKIVCGLRYIDTA